MAEIPSEFTMSADGDSAEYEFRGGLLNMNAWGTWGSGTATLKFSTDSGDNFNTVSTKTTLTADGSGNAELPPCLVKVNLNGSTTPSLTFTLIRIPTDAR